jgi:hypothetical protein
VSHKFKHKSEHFHLTTAVIIRLIIFSLIMVISINYFSTHHKTNTTTSTSTVLGEETVASFSANPVITKGLQDAYSLLPENSRHLLENINRTPLYLNVAKQIDYLKSQSQDFPQKQIKEIQKGIVNKLYQDIINNIDNK